MSKHLFTNKYRPKYYVDVLGQEPITMSLMADNQHNRLQPGYIFSGGYGSGKTTLARIFGRSLLCESPNKGEACNKCEQCLNHLEGTSVNYIEVDAASNGGVDDIRELIKLARTRPVGASHRVILIDECHRLSNQGWDAFLKELEEGSTITVFLFCTTEPDKVRDAIRSRCTSFNILPIQYKDIVSMLAVICQKENIDYEPKALGLIVSYTRGHVRDALNYLDQIHRLGNVDEKNVREYLRLDINVKYFKILENILINPLEAYNLLDQCCSEATPNDIRKGLSNILLDSYKINLGVATDYDMLDRNLSAKLYGLYKDNLLSLATMLLSSKIPMDRQGITCLVLSIPNYVKKSENNVMTGNVSVSKQVQEIDRREVRNIVYDIMRNIFTDKECEKHIMFNTVVNVVKKKRSIENDLGLQVNNDSIDFSNMSEDEKRRIQGTKQYRLAKQKQSKENQLTLNIFEKQEEVNNQDIKKEEPVYNKKEESVENIITKEQVNYVNSPLKNIDKIDWVQIKDIFSNFGIMYLGGN